MVTRYDIWTAEREKAESLTNGLKVLRGQTVGGKPSLMIWKPKATRPFVNYSFKDLESADSYLAKVIANMDSWQKVVDARKADRKATPEKMATISVGDIYLNSWGYDQTNVDFYQIIEIKGCMVTLREISQSRVESDHVGQMSEYRTANKDSFRGEAFRSRVSFSGLDSHVNTKYGRASKWDGRPTYCSWYA